MLTAWESLDFYTQLSLPILLSKEDRFARMDTVMETMGLSHIKQTKAGPCDRLVTALRHEQEHHMEQSAVPACRVSEEACGRSIPRVAAHI